MTLCLASGAQAVVNPSSDKNKPLSSSNEGAKIAIIVNKEVITYQDIQDRARLVLLTSGMSNTPEMLKTVEHQVKKSLIDEKIQLQAAKLQKVFVSDTDIQAALKNIAQDNRMTVEQMQALFQQQGIPIKTLHDRLRAQIAWARTIREAFGGLVQISENEVKNNLEKAKDNSGKDQYELMEIFLRVENPTQQATIQVDNARLALDKQRLEVGLEVRQAWLDLT